MAVHCRCHRQIIFCKIQVRPLSYRSYLRRCPWLVGLLPYAICCSAVYPNFFIRISDTTCILLWLCLSMSNNNTFLRCSLSLLGFMSMAFYFCVSDLWNFNLLKLVVLCYLSRLFTHNICISSLSYALYVLTENEFSRIFYPITQDDMISKLQKWN